MIAKVPAKRNDGRSSFASLGQYITGEKVDRDTGEVLRDAHAMHVETNCLSVRTAAAEMRAVAEMNGRVNDPVYHTIISWREGERPTNKDMVDAANRAMAAVGMSGHQYVFAVHRETDNHHVHIMVNRVNPETYKSVYPDRDFFKLDQCMRETELAQGWQHDEGPYQVVDGQVVKALREQPAEPRLPTTVRDMEAATKCESLLTYAQQVAPEVVNTLAAGGSWQSLHAALRRHGLEIREAGQGFKIFDIADLSTTPIKASDMSAALGGGKLKKQLGAFEKPLRVVIAEKPVRTYNPFREKQTTKVGNPDERDDKQEMRAADRLALRQRFDAEKRERWVLQQERREAEQFALRDLLARTRTERETIRNGNLSAEAKRAKLSVLAMTTIAERERIKLAGKEQREADRLQGYRTWTGDQAAQGDEAAIAQLKSWEYQDSKRRRAAETEDAAKAEQAAILAGQPTHDTPARPAAVLEGVSWQVNRWNGNVTYQLQGLDALRDTGRQISVLQPTDARSIEAGLMLAAQKFGPDLTLTGSMEFQRQAVQIAVEKGLGVRFADPSMEAYRQQLEKTRDAGKASIQQAVKPLAKPQEIKNEQRRERDNSWSRGGVRGNQPGKGRGGH